MGVAGWWFDNADALIETFVRQFLQLNGEAPRWQTYLPPLVMFLIPCAVVLAIGLWHTRYQLTHMKFISSQLQQPEGKKGLIVLVSNPNSAIYAIDYHFLTKGTLEHLWLIPSNDTQADKFGDSTQVKVSTIEDYCKTLNQQGRLDIEIHSTGVSPADAQDTFDYVNRVFRRSGYKPNELIADFTGGIKPMAVGMIMACLPRMRELQYVSFNPKTKQSYGPFLIDYQHSAFDLVG